MRDGRRQLLDLAFDSVATTQRWLFPAAAACLLCVLLAVAASPALAGEDDAFKTLTLSLDVAANSNDETFHQYWDPRAGARVELETPFYLGAVQLGLHVNKNDNKRDDVPAFWSSYIYLGWVGQYTWESGVRLSAGALAGNYLMDFGDPALSDVKALESELAIAAVARVAYLFNASWGIRAGAEYRRVYTARRINLVFVSAGVQWQFDSPLWLQEFLD